MARPNNPTFTKSNQEATSSLGYYSRTMFVFDGEYTVGSGWVDTVNFNGFDDLPANSATNYNAGSYIIAPFYWRDGKVIRITGHLRVLPDGSISGYPLNMRFGLQTSSGTTWLGIQNNNNDHYFDLAGDIPSVPVSFEVTIGCGTAASGSATESKFMCFGYYEYSKTYNEQSQNTDTRYVPVYKPTENGQTVSASYYTGSCALAMNFYGSVVTSIQVINIIIEELA